MPPPKATSRRSEFKRVFVKHLREKSTDAERRLWALLRRKQLANVRFRRLHPVGPYIFDFLCPAAKLVVELDGGQHGTEEAVAYDAHRTKWLEQQGYRVLRFANIDVLNREVIDAIWHHVRIRLPLPERPDGRSTLPQGEGK